MSLLRWLVAVPLGVQALAMVVDELHFHRRRGLGAWERIGHPLDTLTVLACLGWAMFVPPTQRAIVVYVLMAFASCLFITKDEPVHAARCSPGEQWLHAVLFVVHPMSLAVVGLLWQGVHSSHQPAPSWLDGLPASTMVAGQLVVTTVFCLYQILYWNIPWPYRRSSTL